MRTVSARSTGIAFLCVAICTALLVESAQRAAAIPQDCGAAVYTPVRRPILGLLEARAESVCINGTLMYMRLNVQLQRRVEGVWRWRAGAVAVADQPSDRFTVKVSAPCRLGFHRTFSVHSFRANPADPWQVGPRWASPPVPIKRCRH